MGAMHSCVSLILPIALFSGLKNLNREDAKDAKVFRQDQQDGQDCCLPTGSRTGNKPSPAAAPLLNESEWGSSKYQSTNKSKGQRVRGTEAQREKGKE